MVMRIERYLGVYHLIFHKTSVTRRRLLTLLAILIILTTTWIIMSTNDLVISRAVVIGIFMGIFFPPLLKISRQMRRQNAISTEKRRKIHFKNIDTCLLAVAYLVLFSVPTSFYVVFSLVEGSTSENAKLSRVWADTAQVINCSFNSLIFFWKNKVLRDEGIKIIKNK